MSAICGIFHPDGKPVSPEDVDKMIAPLAHSGPDGIGTWREGPVGLAHLMLHVTPESFLEKLPLSDPETGRVITADARIDNREELCEELRIADPERRTMPDSTLIQRAYEKWGEDCPNKLLGAFAFAIWDEKKRQLFCARDQMGFKPFYYHHSPRMFVFSSEIKGILHVPGVPMRLNELALANYLLQKFDDREITFQEEILRLPPAHSLVVRAGRLELRRYWKLQPLPVLKFSQDSEYAEALHEVIVLAVRSCLRSTYPAGVMLSGGLDSSTVACVAAGELHKEGKRLTAVSSVLPEHHAGGELDEREYINAVRDHAGNIDLIYVTAEGATPFDNLEDQCNRMAAPGYDPFWYMTEALFAAARDRGVRVMLDGNGGDTAVSFGGTTGVGQLIRGYANLVSGRDGAALLGLRSLLQLFKSEFVAPLLPGPAHRLYRRITNRRPNNWISRHAIHPEFARRMGVIEPARIRTLPIYCSRVIEEVRSGQTQLGLEDWAARAACFGLEICSPLMDKRVIEFCLRVPAEQHERDGLRRSLVRRAMEGVLPSKVQWRTTKGAFTPDYHRRVLAAKPRLREFLSGSLDHDPAWEYIDKAKIDDLLENVRPWNAGSPWDTEAQRILGRGIMAFFFVRWMRNYQETLDSPAC
jgi:asparagine synthase (glutamine-hydrolysing)